MTTDPTRQPPAPVVPRLARIDVIGGALMIALAALIWTGTIGLDLGQVVNFGPGAMPRVLAALLGLAGAGVLLRGLVQGDAEAEPLAFAWRPTAILVLAVLIFALFIRGGQFWILTTPKLGLLVVGPVTAVVAGLATPEARLKELLVLAFGLTAAAMLVFADLLGVPIPVLPGALADLVPHSFGLDNAVRVAYAGYAALAGLLYLAFRGPPGQPRDD